MRMKTNDGIELFVNNWFVPDNVTMRGSVMIVHGIGEHCLRYNHVALFFNSLGYEVRSYDQRGFGRSEGKKSFLPSENILVDDLKMMFGQFSDEMAKKGFGSPLIFGHSMGGCIVARAVTGGWIKPSGMILSSPGLKPKINWLQKFLLNFLYKILPDSQFPGGLPIQKLTRDTSVIKKVITDPYCHGTVTARIIHFMLTAGAESLRDAIKVNIPTLLVVAGADAYVSPEISKQFYLNLPEGIGTLHIYERSYHEIFNELPDCQKQVFIDLGLWLEKVFNSTI